MHADQADFLAQKTADSQIEILDEDPNIIGVRRAINVNTKVRTRREISEEALFAGGIQEDTGKKQSQGDRRGRKAPGQAREPGDGGTRAGRPVTGDLFKSTVTFGLFSHSNTLL